jgi:hypothetical protein
LPEFEPLRLLAKQDEDVKILAAHLQDALFPLTAMVYERKSATFTLLANRFCWEVEAEDHEGEPVYYRVHSGICCRNIKKIFHRGFERKGQHRVLNLLSLQVPTSQNIRMIFSGDKEIHIETKDLHCHLGDLHHPWPTRIKPVHIYEHLEKMHMS